VPPGDHRRDTAIRRHAVRLLPYSAKPLGLSAVRGAISRGHAPLAQGREPDAIRGGPPTVEADETPDAPAPRRPSEIGPRSHQPTHAENGRSACIPRPRDGRPGARLSRRQPPRRSTSRRAPRTVRRSWCQVWRRPHTCTTAGFPRDTRCMTATITIYGVVVLVFMMVMYALERRGRAQRSTRSPIRCSIEPARPVTCVPSSAPTT